MLLFCLIVFSDLQMWRKTHFQLIFVPFLDYTDIGGYGITLHVYT